MKNHLHSKYRRTRKPITLSQVRQRGFGMLEIGLALLVVAVAIVWAYEQYKGSRSDEKAQDEVADVTRFVSKTQEVYSVLPDYTGVTTLVLIGNNVFNARSVNAARTAVTNRYGGAVTGAPATLVTANDAVAFTSTGYDREGCGNIPNKVANGLRRIDINGTTVKADGANLDPNQVAAACQANANSLIYYVGK